MPFMDECASPASDRPVGNTSGRTVHCVKFQKDLPGLDTPPWPGDLGQRIYENVSAQAWKLWEERQKMILNEYRLMPWQKEAQEIIAKHMEDFFFGAGRRAPSRLRAATGQVDCVDRIIDVEADLQVRLQRHRRTSSISRSMSNASVACASRSDCSTRAGSSPLAKMNPR